MEDKVINIRPEVAKRKRKGRPLPRYIEHLPNTLWSWLAPFLDKQGHVKLDKRNLDHRRHQLCVRAGIEFPRNAGRHSFATYAVAHTSNSGKVRGWTGHRSQQTLEEFYKGMAPKAMGKAYFSIAPTKTTYTLQSKIDPHACKANWPSREELKHLVKKQPVIQIACALGVSDQAVRKRLKKLGLKTMPRGYWSRKTQTSANDSLPETSQKDR